MRRVVFLRGVNVGKANRCQPAVIASQLSRLGVVNIGAVGTFVVREDVSESALRAAIAKKLPVQMRDHDLSRARHHQTRVKRSVRRTTVRTGHHEIRQRVSEATSYITFCSNQSPVSRRVATQDHRDPRKIRSRSVSSPDESDRLPR